MPKKKISSLINVSFGNFGKKVNSRQFTINYYEGRRYVHVIEQWFSMEHGWWRYLQETFGKVRRKFWLFLGEVLLTPVSWGHGVTKHLIIWDPPHSKQLPNPKCQQCWDWETFAELVNLEIKMGMGLLQLKNTIKHIKKKNLNSQTYTYMYFSTRIYFRLHFHKMNW